MKRILMFCLLLAFGLQCQTKVDLRTQSKSADFSDANSTRPFQVGTALPATCAVGQVFFKSNALGGQNIFACTGTNTWMLTGVVNVQTAGTLVASRNVVDFSSGPGSLLTAIDTGNAISVIPAVDFAIVQTRASAQAGTVWNCPSSSGTASAYACSLSPVLSNYTTGMVLRWTPHINNAAGPITLNIDTLGAKAVKLANGVDDPAAGDFTAGALYELWYDGGKFRLLSNNLPGIARGSTRPGCDITRRGRLWFTAAAAGTKDELAVCAADAGGAYQWRIVY